MNSRSLESQVATFLDRRESDPSLSPEHFVREVGAGRELLEALRLTLGVEAELLHSGSAARRRVGPYRTLRVLGRGGMGVVFEVERDGRRFALKRMHAELSSTRARQRFKREAELLQRVEHSGIVAVREVGEDDGVPYLVLELVEGKPLLEVAAEWALERKLRAAIEICSAIAAAHDQGLLHRDLKPQNVLVRDDGRAVVLDFGLGVAQDDVSLTSTGDLLGTPRYMAPEQARAEPTDVRTDVWGLGQILFELVTGRPAIEAQSRERALRDAADARIPSPRSVRADLSPELERIVLQALADAPPRRYPQARELAADLERFLAGVAVHARPPGPLARTWRRILRRPAAAASVLAIAILAASTLFVTRACSAGERRAAARGHLEAALLAWTSGLALDARSEALATLEFAPDDSGARALLVALDGDSATPHQDPQHRAFALFADGRLRDAADALANLDSRELAARIGEAHARRVGAELDAAKQLLDALARDEPRSPVVAAESARASRETGEHARAVLEFERALSLAPGAVALRLELAESLFAIGDSARAVDEALAASRADPTGRVITPPQLARTLGRAPDAAAMRAALEGVLRADPQRPDARFALAVSLDSAHDVLGAARAYRTLLESAPAHPWALVYLGHLRAGADVRKCAECRAVFDARPELIDREDAGDLLARALLADRGRERELTQLVVYLAREHDLDPPALAALEELLTQDLPPAQRSRLLDAREALRR